MKTTTLFCLLLISPILMVSQVTENDGDWSEKYVTLQNTPEADLMVRTGDIDNLYFGFPVNFDPFSGKSTRTHGFPWPIDTLDPSGTDRIMVISSYNGNPPHGSDGYTQRTSRPENSVRPIALDFDFPSTITAARLQMFVDDFQAPLWRANYQVYLDGIRSNELEELINALSQGGPIGKMVTFDISGDLLHLLDDGGNF